MHIGVLLWRCGETAWGREGKRPGPDACGASGFEVCFKRDHLLVEDAADPDAVRARAIENDVLAMLMAAKAGTNRIEAASHPRILS